MSFGRDVNHTLADALVGRTLASDVLYRLRHDILEATLRPGERLRFEALRASYGVSFSTLREALAHLVEEGLVAAEGQRGFRVAPVSRSDLLDLCDVRVMIERGAIGRSLARGDADWVAAVRAAHRALQQAFVDTGATRVWISPDWQRAHYGFHNALVAACGSPTLLQMREMLGNRAMRYRKLAAQLRLPPDDPPDDHVALLDLALARNAEAAGAMAEAQIRGSVAVLERYAGDLLSDP